MKMYTMIKGLLGIFLVCFSLNALAAADLSSLHSSKQGATNQNKMTASASYSRTDIHIVNYSSQIITVKVPRTYINDTLYPNEVDDIYSDVYFDAVEVVLYDEDGYEFFRDYVQNHGVVEVRNVFRGTAAAGIDNKQKGKVQAVVKKK